MKTKIPKSLREQLANAGKKGWAARVKKAKEQSRIGKNKS